MRLVADWALVDGLVQRRTALLFDEQGVVRGVSRAAAHERPPSPLRQAIVVPGGVDACALTALLAEDGPPPTDPGEALRALATLMCAGDLEALQRRARAVFVDAVRAGVTTVALPHLAPQAPAAAAPGHGDADSSPTRFAVAAALAAAADEVGVRLTLLDAMVLRRPAESSTTIGPVDGVEAADPWQRCGHPGLEAAVRHLDDLVRFLLARRTSRLSWGLLLPRPALLGADATLGLRLRLAHLPTVVVDAGERFGRPPSGARIPGADGATLLEQCLGSGALDACCSWLATDPARRAAAAGSVALARAGVATLGPPPDPSSRRTAAGAEAGLHFHGTASANGGGYRPEAWRAALLRPGASGTDAPACAVAAGALPPARVAANALGLRGGTLRPDTWADYAVLRAAPGERLPDTLAGITRALAGVAGATPLRVAEVWVGGEPIFRADGAD